MLAKFLHVRAYEHLPQLAKIAVCGIVHLDDTPRICAPADHASVGGAYGAVRPNNRERNCASYFLRLEDALLVLVLVYRCLKDADTMEFKVGQDLIIKVREAPLSTSHKSSRGL